MSSSSSSCFGVDSRGVPRGRCATMSCSCSVYQSGTAGLKCIGCGHPPGKHHNLTKENAGPYYNSSNPRSNVDYTSDYSPPVHSEPPKTPKTDPCKVQDCTKPCYYDPSVGEFDYCSPACRDRHLLSSEREHLQNDIKTFEDKVKLSVSRNLRQSTSTGRASAHESKESGPTQSYSTAVSSGRQKTVCVQFKKNEWKDIDLIVCDISSGVLVLGFEYNVKVEYVKVEYLIASGKLNLLDVITKVNDKEASSKMFLEKVHKALFCDLIVNTSRSISLPLLLQLALLKHANGLNPTHLVAVFNPVIFGIVSCCNGFGLGTNISGTFVTSVTTNSPANLSGVMFDDMIISWGLVKNNDLETEMGILTDGKQENAVTKGKTLLLVIKRDVIKRRDSREPYTVL